MSEERPFYVIMVDNVPEDVYAHEDLAEAISATMAEPGARLEVKVVRARDAGEARLLFNWDMCEYWGTLIIGED